jgi:flagellar hook-length control protein FliK
VNPPVIANAAFPTPVSLGANTSEVTAPVDTGTDFADALKRELAEPAAAPEPRGEATTAPAAKRQAAPTAGKSEPESGMSLPPAWLEAFSRSDEFGLPASDSLAEDTAWTTDAGGLTDAAQLTPALAPTTTPPWMPVQVASLQPAPVLNEPLPAPPVSTQPLAGPQLLNLRFPGKVLSTPRPDGLAAGSEAVADEDAGFELPLDMEGVMASEGESDPEGADDAAIASRFGDVLATAGKDGSIASTSEAGSEASTNTAAPGLTTAFAQADVSAGAPQTDGNSPTAVANAAMPQPLHLAQSPQHAPAPGGAELLSRFNTPEWHQELQSQVSWQVGAGISEARLSLNPADLGPLDVQVRMTEKGAEVHFIAPHAATREALEQGLQRLRDNLGSQGLLLGDATVSDGRSGWNQRHEPAPERRDVVPGEGWFNAEAIEQQPVQVIARGNRLVDVYA